MVLSLVLLVLTLRHRQSSPERVRMAGSIRRRRRRRRRLVGGQRRGDDVWKIEMDVEIEMELMEVDGRMDKKAGEGRRV
jgi:hypothetical protein